MRKPGRREIAVALLVRAIISVDTRWKDRMRREAATFRRLLLTGLMIAALDAATLPAANADDFDTIVAPLFAGKCLTCHNATDKKGGLDLSSATRALDGGDGGKVIVPSKPDESLLWERVAENEMPPKKPLADEEKQILKRWIAAGAKWGTDPIDALRYTSSTRAGYDWWSLKPVKRPILPNVTDEGWTRNPIDRFVLASLEAKGLRPSPQADKRTLIRRLTFDLLGLPPDPEEVAAFVADNSPEAYDHLVERLLESPHFGERWGRHWLDIVRFGESQGFERDRLRNNAWQYRDWVISAMNDDLPYDEFVRLQLAGDVLHPSDPRAIVATGFLVAAPWDEVGQTQQSVPMKAVVRQDELEDLIGVTGQTFLGLTVNCARCHDHKFDPVAQAEYYRMAAVFAGVRHGEREVAPAAVTAERHPEIAARQAALASTERRLADECAVIDEPIRQKIVAARKSAPKPISDLPRPIACWEFDGDFNDSLGELHGTPHGEARIERGKLILDGKDSYVATAALKSDLTSKSLEIWMTLASLGQRGGGAFTVQSSSGAVFDAIVFGERDSGQWMAGSNGYSRTQSFQGAVETDAEALVQMVIVYGSDRTITAYRNGRRYGTPYTALSMATYEAGKSQALFGLRHSPPGGDRFLGGAIERAALYDRALSADEVAALAGVSSDVITDEEVLAGLSRDAAHHRQKIALQLSRVRSEVRLLAGGGVYAVNSAVPDPTFILDRGNPALRRGAVLPGAIKSISALSPEFGLVPEGPEGARRERLADWIIDSHNPLTPRVIINRLWHYHFGTAIVDTPNDFGFNGGRPSHPELLDWLASELLEPTPITKNRNSNSSVRNAPWSLKRLHRLIVTSAAYRQSSLSNAAAGVDAGNRLLWHKTPQRLEAEALRDAILVVAGEFNPTMGGPGFRDFRTFTFNSQFYEPIDPVGYEYNRRTVYRTWVRSGRNDFLDVFDCPDPSTTAPRRAVTTTPLQALALLNNSFTLRMADRLAARATRESDRGLDNEIRRVYDLAFHRPAQPEELAEAKGLVLKHGLPAFCRVVFNANEFLYVD